MLRSIIGYITFSFVSLLSRVSMCGRTYITTVYSDGHSRSFRPISYLVLAPDPGGNRRRIFISFHWRSFIAGWLPVLSLLLLVLPMIANGLRDQGYIDRDANSSFVHAGIVVGCMLIARIALGRLSGARSAQQKIYGEFFGHAVDVSLLGDHRTDLRESLIERVVELGRGVSASGYRGARDPRLEWAAIALDDTMESDLFLRATLTLARIEWSLAVGDARRGLKRVHDAIWVKIQRRKLISR